MRCKQNIYSHERIDPRIFGDVVVVADQDADLAPQRRVEDGELITAVDVLAHKNMELAMPMHRSVGLRYDVCVKKPVPLRLHQPSTYYGIMFLSQS